MRELLRRSAIELSNLVGRGEVSAVELVQVSLDAISDFGTKVGALTFVDADQALAEASAVVTDDPRPFAGVPIAIKDIAPVAGMPLTGASDLYGDYRAAEDSHAVRRLREAGFIIVGKTNLSEFGVVPAAEPRRGPTTRNPWDPSRTPGGSSGGSAAAVAAGMLPLAHGNDGGGSIRVPAAFFGLVGLKPSRGRISRGPEAGEDFFVQDGVLTRSVADTVAVLDVLAGPEPGDSSWLPVPQDPFAISAGQEPRTYRIAVTTAGPLDGPLEDEVVGAIRQTADLLSDFGHDVFEWEAAYDEQFGALLGPTLGARLAESMVAAGRATQTEPSPELLEPLAWRIYSGVKAMPVTEYLAATADLQRLTRRFIEGWAFDLLLLPAVGTKPLPIGALNCSGADLAATLEAAREFTRFTSFFNATGQPAISLPASVAEGGLPLAVQLVGPPAGEAALLAVASQLEESLRWFERRPALLSQAQQASDPVKAASP